MAEERAVYYKFEWKIKNLSYWCEQVHGKYIKSPEGAYFTERVELYPIGYSGRMEVRFCGLGFSDEVEPGVLSFVGPDGTLICSQQVNNTERDEVVLKLAVKFEDLVSLLKNVEDEVILRYQVQQDHFCDQRFCTVIEVSEYSFNIDSNLFENVNLGTLSYIFHESERDHPIELNVERGGEIICFMIEPSNVDGSISVIAVVSILDRDNTLIRKEECGHVFPEEESWTFCKLKEFEEKETTIKLRLKIIGGKTLEKYNYESNYDKVSMPITLPDSSKQLDDSATVLKEELMCLYQNQKFSDFTLNCGDVTFPVHKNILSARSPVFENMLSCDMKESTSGRVDITDLDPSTLAGRLHAPSLYPGITRGIGIFQRSPKSFQNSFTSTISLPGNNQTTRWGRVQ